MVVGSIGHGSIDGDLFAMLMTLGYALMIVMIRRWQHVSMVPAVLVGTMLAVLASTPLARPLAPGWQDFVWLALFGLSQMGLALILFTTGAPKIPEGEVALLGVLEVVLAPIWVWLAFDEVPSGATLLGGGLVLAAVFGHIAKNLLSESSRTATYIAPPVPPGGPDASRNLEIPPCSLEGARCLSRDLPLAAAEAAGCRVCALCGSTSRLAKPLRATGQPCSYRRHDGLCGPRWGGPRSRTLRGAPSGAPDVLPPLGVQFR